jgi:hypothetical protein
MQTAIKKVNISRILLLGVFFTTLLSFSTKWGGEGFEIYLNNKLVLQQFGNQLNSIQTIQLDPGSADSRLSVKYFHCGRVGTNRSITIRDGQNRILKEWKFADVSTTAVSITDPSMTCKVSDILGLKKSNPGKLNLYYSSKELPKGRILAFINAGEDAKTK